MVAICTILLVIFLTFLCRKEGISGWVRFTSMVVGVVAYTVIILRLGER